MIQDKLLSMQRFLHAAEIAIGRVGGLAWALVGERDPARQVGPDGLRFGF